MRRIEEKKVRLGKKGFTLIELLAVVAILALLVSIVVPSVHSSVMKSRGATDAANLRSSLGWINAELADDKSMDEIAMSFKPIESKVAPNAELWIVYGKPACLYTYFVENGKFYSMDYMVDVARSGKSDRDTRQPTHVGKWYAPGIGWIDPSTGKQYEH